MSISKATTDLSTLKINALTEQMYRDALSEEEIEANELYMTPFDCGYEVEESQTTLLAGNYSITNLDSYGITQYDAIFIDFTDVSDYLPYITEDYLEITIGNDTYIMPRIENNDGDNHTPYACYGLGYGASVDWSTYSFVVHIYDYEGVNKTTNINIYVKPDYFTSPVTVTIEDYNQTVTTTPDFNAAVSHVLETNLQSVEGGSY